MRPTDAPTGGRDILSRPNYYLCAHRLAWCPPPPFSMHRSVTLAEQVGSEAESTGVVAGAVAAGAAVVVAGAVAAGAAVVVSVGVCVAGAVELSAGAEVAAGIPASGAGVASCAKAGAAIASVAARMMIFIQSSLVGLVPRPAVNHQSRYVSDTNAIATVSSA
jgi:hypothetical protein